MSSTGRAGIRHKDDFYRTPDWCTCELAKLLMKLVPEDLTTLASKLAVCDPCAGDGAIVHKLHALGFRNLSAVELIESRADMINRKACGDVVVADFLKLERHHLATLISVFATNPPFSIAQQVAEHCFAMNPNGIVALLLRVNFLSGKKRKTFFEKHPFDVNVFAKRPSFAETITWQVSRKSSNDKGEPKWIKAAGPFIEENEHEARVACRGLSLEHPRETFKVERKKTTGDSCEYAWFVSYPGCKRQWSRIEND